MLHCTLTCQIETRAANVSREYNPPAAIDVRVKRYAPHVRITGEVGNLVPDLKRPGAGPRMVTEPHATRILTAFVRHRRKDMWLDRRIEVREIFDSKATKIQTQSEKTPLWFVVGRPDSPAGCVRLSIVDEAEQAER